MNKISDNEENLIITIKTLAYKELMDLINKQKSISNRLNFCCDCWGFFPHIHTKRHIHKKNILTQSTYSGENFLILIEQYGKWTNEEKTSFIRPNTNIYEDK
jgi:hypothetical protein